MRVLAGALKGQRLTTPRGRTTRPTADQVRIACLDTLARHEDGGASPAELEAAAAAAARLANQHPGSRSLDGVGHAAVSASYAVAHALAGRALRAADYAAYASVYGEGGYGAVQQRESFQPEFDWQVQALRRFAAEEAP